MDLGQIAQELYSVPPEDFIAARKESVAAAKAAGDQALSKAIGELRKPSAAAALVNVLAREAEDLLQEVVDLGEELREAQEQGDGKRLRELNAERKTLLRRVAAESVELAEEYDLSHAQPCSTASTRRSRRRWPDPDAAKAVQAGLLVSALSGAGMGFIDLSDSVALPDFELKPRESKPKERRLKSVPDLPDPKVPARTRHATWSPRRRTRQTRPMTTSRRASPRTRPTSWPGPSCTSGSTTSRPSSRPCRPMRLRRMLTHEAFSVRSPRRPRLATPPTRSWRAPRNGWTG